MTKHVLAVHRITLGSCKARVTPPSSFKRIRLPSKFTDDEDTVKPTNEPLAGCSTTSHPTTVAQYSQILDATQPSSPVPLPVVVIHFDTDESDPEELSVPIITKVRTVTSMTNPTSPICISDTETNQIVTTGPLPMKRFLRHCGTITTP